MSLLYTREIGVEVAEEHTATVSIYEDKHFLRIGPSISISPSHLLDPYFRHFAFKEPALCCTRSLDRCFVSGAVSCYDLEDRFYLFLCEKGFEA